MIEYRHGLDFNVDGFFPLFVWTPLHIIDHRLSLALNIFAKTFITFSFPLLLSLPVGLCLVLLLVWNGCVKSVEESLDVSVWVYLCFEVEVHHSVQHRALTYTCKKIFNKYLTNTKLYSVEFLRIEMTSDPSNSNRGHEL